MDYSDFPRSDSRFNQEFMRQKMSASFGLKNLRHCLHVNVFWRVKSPPHDLKTNAESSESYNTLFDSGLHIQITC